MPRTRGVYRQAPMPNQQLSQLPYLGHQPANHVYQRGPYLLRNNELILVHQLASAQVRAMDPKGEHLKASWCLTMPALIPGIQRDPSVHVDAARQGQVTVRVDPKGLLKPQSVILLVDSRVCACQNLRRRLLRNPHQNPQRRIVRLLHPRRCRSMCPYHLRCPHPRHLDKMSHRYLFSIHAQVHQPCEPLCLYQDMVTTNLQLHGRHAMLGASIKPWHKLEEVVERLFVSPSTTLGRGLVGSNASAMIFSHDSTWLIDLWEELFISTLPRLKWIQLTPAEETLSELCAGIGTVGLSS